METSEALQGVKPSYIREILKAAKSPNMISLAGGLPSTEMIPTDLFSKALLHMCEQPAQDLCDLFQYGETAGYPPLLTTLREYYSINKDQSLMITNGSQQGLDLIARAFINPGEGVALEAPSYLGALQVFGLSQANIQTIKQNNDGPDLNELEQLFSSHQIKLFYAVPDFHNPTGVCWSLNTRKQVAKLCQQYHVTLVEDAPYRDLRFNGQVLPLASSFCEDQSIVLRSFSKIAAPGIRLGMVSAPEHVLAPLIKIKQAADLHTAIPLQAALMSVLKDKGFPQHINTIKNAYQDRYQQFSELLSRLKPYGGEFNRVDGGMFVWLTLPKINALETAKDLLQQGIAVVPSTVFYHDSVNTPTALRLNFTHATPNELNKAVEVIRNYLKDKTAKY